MKIAAGKEFLSSTWCLNLDSLEERHGAEAMRTLAPALAFFRFGDVLRSQGRLLSLTPRGYYAWVILMREFFTGVNSLRQDSLARSRRGST